MCRRAYADLAVSLGAGGPLRSLALGSRVAVIVVRHIDTSIGGSLEHAEDARTAGGTRQTHIEQGLEGLGSLLILRRLHVVLLSVNLSLAVVLERELCVDAASQQQTGGIGSGVVGQTQLDSIAGQLVRVSGGQHHIVRQIRSDDLGDDVAVGDANDQTVLGSLRDEQHTNTRGRSHSQHGQPVAMVRQPSSAKLVCALRLFVSLRLFV